MDLDLLGRLDFVATLKTGDPYPDWLPVNAWGVPFSLLCADAAAEIRHLRSLAGAVSSGPQYLEIRAMSHDSVGKPHPILKAFDGA